MQTRLGSLAESAINVAIGYGVSFVANLFILPLFGYPVTTAHAAKLGLIFTGIALVRSYCLRRIFEWYARWRVN